MHYHPLRAVFLTAALVAASSYPAKALTFWIDSVVGVWTEVLPGSGVTKNAAGNQISWGTPASGSGKSSYKFEGVAPPSKSVALPETSFKLGTFTHNNYPIYGTSLTSATLHITITGRAVDGSETTAFSAESDFKFTHVETPNTGYNCCKDIVTAVLNEGGKSNVFSIDDEFYYLDFTGFLVDGATFAQFLTKEDQKNKAYLMGSFHEVDPPPGGSGDVPLPAALPLFASILAGGGLVAWRRKRKTSNTTS